MNKLLVFVLITSICLTLLLGGYNFFMSITHPIKFKDEIIYISNKFELSPALVSSVINVESSYKTNAKSNKNAIGLMQIKLSTANYIGNLNNLDKIQEYELFNATTNIEYGCRYLRYLIDKFDDTYTALASYNAGETIVRNWLKNKDYSIDGKILKTIPYKETNNYINKIKSNLKYYKKIYKN